MKLRRKLTIFEGPDGCGKTTAAKAYAKATDALYVHFPQLPHVSKNLGRMYVEAMLPALLGYQDVVFDRCWISELPYATVFREGRERLTTESCRMLDRLAMTCSAVVVLCLPSVSTAVDVFNGRTADEMLNTSSQLEDVYALYVYLAGSGKLHQMPTLVYDWQACGDIADYIGPVDRLAGLFWVNTKSAGNCASPLISIIGDNFAERKDCDPWYQWPFASFSDIGYSQHVTNIITLPENQLFWTNADTMTLFDARVISKTKSIVLGNRAAAKFDKVMGDYALSPRDVLYTSQPQAMRRFGNNYAKDVERITSFISGE